MAVNQNFYDTTNELVARATKGIITSIVDYNTFIDAGKALADMDISEWGNDFMKALINKVQLTVDTFRSYDASLADMTKSTVKGGAIEMLMHNFYSARKALFTNLTDGSTVDPFEIFKPTIRARYYVDTDVYTFAITRTDDDIRGAFTTPNALDSFYRNIIGDILNSIELHKETQRLNVICVMAKEAIAHNTESTTLNNPSTCYNLLKIYNTVKGTSLSVAESLYNDDFILFAAQSIREILLLSSKASNGFNIANEITFTPKNSIALKLNSKFESAMRRALVGAYNPGYAMLADYEVLPYWQNIKDVMRFTTNDSGATTYSPYMLAIAYDKDYACGEYPDFNEAESIRNPRGRYTDTYWNIKTRYIRNGNANTIAFVIA